MSKHIHIVCPEVPYLSSPADMVDTYYQLQYLQDAGYNIILHCFHDDAVPAIDHLENLVTRIHLYPRNQGHKGVSIRHPYCISSRSNPMLLENILRQICPVLFQGISSTFFLPELALGGYKTFVRINGIASELYEANISCEKSIIKKAYSYNEARLIRKWEEIIAEHAATIITTSISDKERFSELYKSANTKYVAPLVPMPQIKTQPGTGMYCLYFGDLSNAENENMVYWLAEKVFRKIPLPLIVVNTCQQAKQPDLLHQESNVCIVCNPADNELTELIQKAQIVLLPRCHKNGFDKRLVLALEKGRYCICNDEMVEGTGLENLFIIANGCNEIANRIERYFSVSFTERDICDRTSQLTRDYYKKQFLQEIIENAKA